MSQLSKNQSSRGKLQGSQIQLNSMDSVPAAGSIEELNNSQDQDKNYFRKATLAIEAEDIESIWLDKNPNEATRAALLRYFEKLRDQGHDVQ